MRVPSSLFWIVSTCLVFTLLPASADGDVERPKGTARVEQLIDEVKYEEAIEAALELVTECESQYGGTSFELASACDLLAKAMKSGRRSNEPEALEAAERAVSIKEQLFEGAHEELGLSIHTLGVVLLDQGVRDRAKEQFERALAMRRELGIDRDTAATLGSLAILAATGGRPDEAGSLFEESLELFQEAHGPDHEMVGRAHRNLGIFHRVQGNPEVAAHHLQRALDIAETVKGPDHPHVADAASALAGLQLKLGNYRPARENFERALRIHEATSPEGSLRIAAQYEGLGLIAMQLGDNEQAADYLQRGVRVYEANDPGTSAGFRAIMANLGVVHIRRGDFEAARRALERTLAMRQEVTGLRSASTAEAHTWLGLAETRLGQTDTAIPRLEMAVALLDSTRGPTNSLTGDALGFLGQAYAAAGRLDDALAVHDRAVMAVEAELGEGLNLSTKLIRRSSIHQRRGAFDLAMADAMRAENMARESYRYTAQTLTEREAREFAATRTDGMDMTMTALLAREDRDDVTADAWNLVIRSRALVLEELLERRRTVLRAEDPGLAAKVEAVAEARRELATRYVKGAGDEPAAFEAELAACRQAADEAELDLARSSSGFRRWQQADGAGLHELGGALTPDQALVAYVQYQRMAPPNDPLPHYAAFVLRDGKTRVYDLGDAASLEALIGRWRATIQDGRIAAGPIAEQLRDRCRRIGGELRARIWDPMAVGLADVGQVFLVPDGDLNLVPIPALPDDSDGWLVEQPQLVHVLGAERQLAVTHEGSPGQDLLALGAPDFDRDTDEALAFDIASFVEDVTTRGVRPDCAAFREMRFRPLSGAALECDEIARAWRQNHAGEVRLLTAADATEGGFKRSAPGHRVIHLATHGYFLGEGCASEPTVANHPLLLSGLAMAGANRRHDATPDQEDGVLTAEEIALLDLGGTEWAVLSACDTGSGAILSGEGVYGLRRAFEVAGARTVIMSLWSVDDETTRQWMSSLYEARFGEGVSTPEAMHAASRTLLEELRSSGRSDHPFWWAGFVAMGDWR